MALADPTQSAACQAGPRLDAASAEWLAALRGPDRSVAVSGLHELMLRIARSELRRRNSGWQVTGPELDDLAHQAAADALVSVTAKLDAFRGDSRFTTWAYKFVIFEVSAKLGRHFWQRARRSLEPEDWDRLPDRLSLQPSEVAESKELLEALHHAVDETLTPRQQQVFVALVLEGVPLDALVVKLGTNRNALYKMMFDARQKLRAALVAGVYLEPEKVS